LFCSKDLFDSVGGFDERYQFAEEWPFTTKLLESGNKIYLLDKYLYDYRVQEGSLCREEGVGQNRRVFFDMKRYFYNEGFKVLVKKGNIFYAWHLFLTYWYTSMKYDIKKNAVLFRSAKLVFLFSPVAYLNFFKKLCTVSCYYDKDIT
jgi:hypothetical protein